MYHQRYFRRLLKASVISAILILVCSGETSADERYTVTGEIANIRSGPGTNHEILFKAEKYYPVKVLKKTGNWYQIEDFEGDRGWIHKSLIDKIPSVITTKKKCNVRSGPGTNYDIEFITELGVPFKVLKRKGNWINVQHSDGAKGWIHKSLVW